MSTAHTPDPWRFHAVVLAGEVHGYTVSKGGDVPRLIANVLPIDETATEGGANARLIAAAPELLAALEAYIAQYGRPHRDEWLSDDALNQAIGVHEQARAAIAKATGAQS